VKILDFGIAKLESATRITREGSTLGTAGYMSPEQAKGEETGPETDVWATGVILYEMLTGRRPFAGEHEAAVLYEVVHEEPEPLPEEVIAANPGIQEIVERSLSKEPEDRYRSSGEMRSAIEGFRSGSVQTGKHPARPGSGFSLKTSFRWGLIVVLIAAAIFILFKFVRQEGDSLPDKMKIAVLPFANLGPQDDEYFSDGITDEITGRLASVRSIRVMSRQSVIRYKGSDKSPEEIAEELGGVDYIIEGTVQRERPSDSTSTVRIRPKLIFVKDGTQVWGDKYDEKMVDIFAIYSDIAEKIAKALDVALPGSGEKGKHGNPTHDLRAYEYYLKGKSIQYQAYYVEKDMLASIDMYEKALAIEPDYVEALSAFAINCMWLVFQHYEVDSLSARAEEAIDRILEIDPGSPDAYLARGTYKYVLLKDYRGALEDYMTAYNKNPSSFETLNSLGWAQRRLGQWDKARESFLKAKELNPGEVSQNVIIGEHLAWMRRFDEAEYYLDLALTLDPARTEAVEGLIELYLGIDGSPGRAKTLLVETMNNTGSDDILYFSIDGLSGQRILIFSDSLLVRRIRETSSSWSTDVERHGFFAEMYKQTGELELARSHYDSLRVILEARLSAEDEVKPIYYPEYIRLGLVYASLGMKEKAIAYGLLGVEKLPVSDDAVQGLVHEEKLAMIYTITGEYDKAFDLLDRLASMPASRYLRLDPVWDPIRDDPRFDKLIEKYSEASN